MRLLCAARIALIAVCGATLACAPADAAKGKKRGQSASTIEKARGAPTQRPARSQAETASARKKTAQVIAAAPSIPLPHVAAANEIGVALGASFGPTNGGVAAVALVAAAGLLGDGEKRRPGAGEAMTLEQFLDRLMMAESGGNAFARNSRSTATGPFQFIASTWLQIANKHFSDVIGSLSPGEILALRTDMTLARRAAQIYTEDNAAYLVANGHKATFPHLRLAFLVGAGGAVRVLSAKPDAPVGTLLGATFIGANPFMARMTTDDLVARCARDISTDRSSVAALDVDADAIQRAAGAKASKRPKIAVACNLVRASCKKWLALANKRLSRLTRLKKGKAERDPS